jgi:hypothetical protein
LFAISKALQQGFAVAGTDKQVYPINYGKTYKVEFAAIAKLILTAHSLKLHF